jgi:ubiquinone/menaquinone biosynthesis C-methylase UbiE
MLACRDMNATQHTSTAQLLSTSEFWDALAPYHSSLENSYLDLRSIRRIMNELGEPVLVVGAGQGLIVAEIRKRGLQCDGVDLSPEMIRYAKLRRGISLIHADARAMPFAGQTYGTLIFATGVIDFTGDEPAIQLMLKEAKRIVKDSGKIFVGFYRISSVLESFMTRVGLLSNNRMAFRRSLELYLLNPAQTIAWVTRKAGLSYFGAAALLLHMAALTTIQEKRMTFRMQKIFRNTDVAKALMDAAPEKQPYRNEAEIRSLFKRLAVPIKELRIFPSCYMVRIQ